MRRIMLCLALLPAGLSFACPENQYEMCVLPRPWGGCAQNVCVPNGGTIVDDASDNLADLNQGVIHLGSEVVNTSQQLGQNLSSIANQINWPKVDPSILETTALVGVGLFYGAVCVASDGASPGGPAPVGPGGTIVCSTSSCACAAVALAMAVKGRTDMSPEQKPKVAELANDSKFAEIMQRPAIISETHAQLSAMGIHQVFRDPIEHPRCSHCQLP